VRLRRTFRGEHNFAPHAPLDQEGGFGLELVIRPQPADTAKQSVEGLHVAHPRRLERCWVVPVSVN